MYLLKDLFNEILVLVLFLYLDDVFIILLEV